MVTGKEKGGLLGWISFIAIVVVTLLYHPYLRATELSEMQAIYLYGVAYGNVGIGLPERAPVIRSVPQAEIAQRYCGKSCSVRAAQFGPEILADEKLDYSDPRQSSIVLHELVHYVQWARLGPVAPNDCQEHRRRELQAYAIQVYALDRIDVQFIVPELPACPAT